MKARTRRRRPSIIVRGGKPVAVILGISDYRKMLQQLDDIEDLKELEEMRKKPLRFRKLSDFLTEHIGSE